MALHYLDFDYSEDTAGVGSFEAMASAWPQQVAAVHAEVVRVLDWAHASFPGERGPLEEGHAWDYELQGSQEVTAPETLRYDETTRQLSATVGPAGTLRHTLTLTISGTEAFCAAFRQQFGLG